MPQNPVAIEAIEKSIKSTREFFAGPGMLKKWALFAIIVTIFSLFSAESLSGGGNIDIPSGSDYSSSDSYSSSYSGSGTINNAAFEQPSMPPNSVTGLAVAAANGIDWGSILKNIGQYLVVFLIFLIIIVFILRVIGNAAFFAAIRCVQQNDVQFGWISQNMGKGLALTIFQAVFFLVELPFLVAALLGGIVLFFQFFSAVFSSFSKASGSDLSMGSALQGIYQYLPFLQNPVAPAALLFVGIVGMIILGVLYYCFKQFGYYLMAAKDYGAFQAFTSGISLAFSDIVELIILVAVQIGFGIAIAIISIFVWLIFIIPIIVALAIGTGILILAQFNVIAIAALAIIGFVLLIFLLYVTSFIYSPVYVFAINFNLNVLQGFEDKRHSRAGFAPAR